MIELEIPDESWAAARAAYKRTVGSHHPGALANALAAASPGIVAAEFRRLADQWFDQDWHSADDVLTAIRRRADELDPPADQLDI